MDGMGLNIWLIFGYFKEFIVNINVLFWDKFSLKIFMFYYIN